MNIFVCLKDLKARRNDHGAVICLYTWCRSQNSNPYSACFPMARRHVFREHVLMDRNLIFLKNQGSAMTRFDMSWEKWLTFSPTVAGHQSPTAERCVAEG